MTLELINECAILFGLALRIIDKSKLKKMQYAHIRRYGRIWQPFACACKKCTRIVATYLKDDLFRFRFGQVCLKVLL